MSEEEIEDDISQEQLSIFPLCPLPFQHGCCKPKKDLTKEQWKIAYWKLRRKYRKENLNFNLQF